MAFFSNSEKRFSLLLAQVNIKCPDSSLSRLKRHCFTNWIEDHDAVFVFKEFYPAVVGYLNQLSESRDGEVLGKAIFYVKATTTPGFLVCLEVINATLNPTKSIAQKLLVIKETILSALDARIITNYKDVIRAFRDNKKYLLDYSGMPMVSMGNPYSCLEL